MVRWYIIDNWEVIIVDFIYNYLFNPFHRNICDDRLCLFKLWLRASMKSMQKMWKLNGKNGSRKMLKMFRRVFESVKQYKRGPLQTGHIAVAQACPAKPAEMGIHMSIHPQDCLVDTNVAFFGASKWIHLILCKCRQNMAKCDTSKGANRKLPMDLFVICHSGAGKVPWRRFTFRAPPKWCMGHVLWGAWWAARSPRNLTPLQGGTRLTTNSGQRIYGNKPNRPPVDPTVNKKVDSDHALQFHLAKWNEMISAGLATVAEIHLPICSPPASEFASGMGFSECKQDLRKKRQKKKHSVLHPTLGRGPPGCSTKPVASV